MVRNTLMILFVGVSLAACQDKKSPAAQQRITEEEIGAFCNSVAAEVVANPNGMGPLRRLQQKALEEEWKSEDVDRICSAAVARKTALLYGTPTVGN
ncbi:MAG: hypothetical protein DCF29_02230 [Alphaproteobacteria bacterium]|nr:MAG: hypothetical protein DCF29_02230 [Alphaproteobacteria bacterium]